VKIHSHRRHREDCEGDDLRYSSAHSIGDVPTEIVRIKVSTEVVSASSVF